MVQTLSPCHIPIGGLGQTATLPVLPDVAPDMTIGVEVVPEDLPAPAAPAAPLKPLGMKEALRLVVIGGGQRLGSPAVLCSKFRRKPVAQISFPENPIEAGICIASADAVLFDLTGVSFGTMLDALTTIRQYAPRAVTGALLESGAPLQGIPDCGLSFVTADLSPEQIALLIESHL